MIVQKLVFKISWKSCKTLHENVDKRSRDNNDDNVSPINIGNRHNTQEAGINILIVPCRVKTSF